MVKVIPQHLNASQWELMTESWLKTLNHENSMVQWWAIKILEVLTANPKKKDTQQDKIIDSLLEKANLPSISANLLR